MLDLEWNGLDLDLTLYYMAFVLLTHSLVVRAKEWKRG